MIDNNALLEYVQYGTVPAGPLTVHIDVTNACNLDCVTCWNHSPYLKEPKPPEWKKLKLSLTDYEKIIADLKEVGVKKLILSGGGEPFTHGDIYQMIASAKAAGFGVTVITNALLIDTARLLEHPPDRLLVNLCAATAETYTLTHPNRRTAEFEALERNLKALNEHIPLNLVMVISNINYREVSAMAESAAGFRDAQLSFKLASLTDDTAGFALTEAQKRELLEDEIPRAEGICNDKSLRHNLDIFRDQLRGEGMAYPIEETGCFAGLFYSRIYASGDVFYCCAHIKVGNVFEESFSRVWRGEVYRKMRERLAAKRFFPQCGTCGKFNLNFKARQALATDYTDEHG